LASVRVKNLFSLMLFPLACFGQGQGVSVRANNGIATNLSHAGIQTNLPSAVGLKLTANASGTAYSWIDTNNIHRVSVVGNSVIVRGTNDSTLLTISNDLVYIHINGVAVNRFVVGSSDFNTNAALTVDEIVAFNPATDFGPYLSGRAENNRDNFILGLDNEIGGTDNTQTIKTALGLTDGIRLEVAAGHATDGEGGRLTLIAGNGTNNDGGDVIISAGIADGGDAGEMDLTASFIDATTAQLSVIGGRFYSELGVASDAPDAAVPITSTGWTNTFPVNAVVYFSGTGIFFTNVLSTGAVPWYTNSTTHTGAMSVTLQPGEAIRISGTSVVGQAKPF
jgi:hypothetical protein